MFRRTIVKDKKIWSLQKINMNKGSDNFALTSYKKLTLLVALVLLSSCSSEQDAQTVSKQQIDNPTAANDRVADSNYKPNKIAADNPFIQASEELSQNEGDNDQANLGDNQDDYSHHEPEHVPDAVVFQGNDNGYVEWQAPVEVAYVVADVVVITPSGKRLSRSYTPGEPMVLDENLPDGFYTWESVVTPEIDPYARKEMIQARESGNLQQEQALMQKLRDQGSIPTATEARENKQSGAFLVTDGVAISIEEANKAADQFQREDG